jgi:hypothetical protein
MIYFNIRPNAMKTRTASNNNSNSGTTTLQFTFLFSFLVLFITTKSATSFTCLQPTIFLRRTVFESTDEPCNHPLPLSARMRPLQQQVELFFNFNSILRPSYHQAGTNFRTKLYSNIRWGAPPQKFIRYTSSSSSPGHSTSSSSSSSSSIDSNTSNNSRLVPAVVVDSKEDQIEAIQMIFTNYCDADGLMTKIDAMKVPYIADLLVCCILI